MSDRQVAAAGELVALGVDPATLSTDPVPDATVATLRTLVAGPDGVAVANALGALDAPSVPALLLALEPHATRVGHRAIRRALYRLAQRKVAIPERPPSPAPGRAGAPALEALLSPFDRDGDRLIWLMRELPLGGSLVAYAHVHEPRGLLEFSAGEVGRKRLRELRRRMTADHGLALVPVDWRIADALLVEAQARLEKPDSRHDYLRVRPRFTTAEPAAPAEPVSARVTPLDDAERSALVAASAALLEEPEVRAWWPAESDARPFIAEMEAVRESPLLVSRAAQEERLREILRRAAQTLTPPTVLARRLDGTAYVLAESGRVPAARLAMAVAVTLHEQPDDAADIPVVALLTERALGQMLATDTAQHDEAQRGSLVVTPAQFLRDHAAARDQSSSHPGRTRS